MSGKQDSGYYGTLGVEHGASTEFYARGSPAVEPSSGDTEIMDQALERERKQIPDTEIIDPDQEFGPEEPCGDTLIIQSGEDAENPLDPKEDPGATQANEADDEKTPVRPGSLPPPAFLEIAFLDGKKEVHSLNLGKTTIGRKKYNDIVLKDSEQFISRQHVYIISRQGRYFVADSNSCNGTRLQEQEIKGVGEVPLNEGDTIEIEGLELILRFKETS